MTYTMPSAVTGTCPECGHTHSVAAETVDAARLISKLKAELDETRRALTLRKKLSDGYSAALMAAEQTNEAREPRFFALAQRFAAHAADGQLGLLSEQDIAALIYCLGLATAH